MPKPNSKTIIVALASFVLAAVLYNAIFHRPTRCEPTKCCPVASKPATKPAEKISSENLTQKAVSTIASYNKIDANKIELKKIQWLDLAGDGKDEEFYCEYYIDRTRYLSVYTTRDGDIRRLFHERSFYVNIKKAEFDGREYLIIYSIEGSGGFLGFEIFEWDGAGPLTSVYPEPEKQKDMMFFKGSIWVLNGKVFITGGSQKFELVRQNGKFKLEQYKHHPSYPQLGNKRHILRPMIKDDELIVLFDGKEIEFVTDKKSLDYVNKQPIELELDDEIVLDENLVQTRGLRVFLMDTNAEWESGFFPVLKPTKKGPVKAAINDSYGPWYYININVVKETNR